MYTLFRRAFILGILSILACLFYGFFIEPKLLKTRHVAVKSDAWRGAPLRIGVMTDIHMGGLHVDDERVSDLVDHMMALTPDIIVLPGDFIDGHTKREARSKKFNVEIDLGLAALDGLQAPLGVFATLGNHDNWYGATEVEARLREAGITVLTNSAAQPDSGLCLIGLADSDTARPDPGAYNGCAEAGFWLATAHSPDVLTLDLPRTDLLVTGHTHGGQINLPLLGRAVTSTNIGKPYAYGLSQFGDIPVFISAGIGTSILPARFRAPPEIVLIVVNP